MMKVEEKEFTKFFRISLKYDMVNNLISFNRHSSAPDSINRINTLEGQKVLTFVVELPIILFCWLKSRQGKVYD